MLLVPYCPNCLLYQSMSSRMPWAKRARQSGKLRGPQLALLSTLAITPFLLGIVPREDAVVDIWIGCCVNVLALFISTTSRWKTMQTCTVSHCHPTH